MQAVEIPSAHDPRTVSPLPDGFELLLLLWPSPGREYVMAQDLKQECEKSGLSDTSFFPVS